MLFVSEEPAPCEDACDTNDDGTFNISDVIYTLSRLFSQGDPPPSPFPECGDDPTDDTIFCEAALDCR